MSKHFIIERFKPPLDESVIEGPFTAPFTETIYDVARDNDVTEGKVIATIDQDSTDTVGRINQYSVGTPDFKKQTKTDRLGQFGELNRLSYLGNASGGDLSGGVSTDYRFQFYGPMVWNGWNY